MALQNGITLFPYGSDTAGLPAFRWCLPVGWNPAVLSYRSRIICQLRVTLWKQEEPSSLSAATLKLGAQAVGNQRCWWVYFMLLFLTLQFWWLSALLLAHSQFSWLHSAKPSGKVATGGFFAQITGWQHCCGFTVLVCTGDLITSLLAGNCNPWRQQQQQKAVD